MGLNGTGLNAYNSYLATMNNRMGLHGGAAGQMKNNAEKSGTDNAVAAQNAASPEAAKNEGKTDTSTLVPPPGDIGKILDFKV